MGSSQSTRKLTIANEEEDNNVITISEAVAKRLAESASAEPAQLTTTKSTSTSATHVTTTQAIPERSPLPHELTDVPYPQYTISALTMQQIKNKELAEQEVYWKRRLQNLEKNHEKINHTIEDEYQNALSIFDDCKVVKVQNEATPCNENKQKVLKCYQDNPKEPLRCSDLVQQFSNCVDNKRAQMMKCN